MAQSAKSTTNANSGSSSASGSSAVAAGSTPAATATAKSSCAGAVGSAEGKDEKAGRFTYLFFLSWYFYASLFVAFHSRVGCSTCLMTNKWPRCYPTQPLGAVRASRRSQCCSDVRTGLAGSSGLEDRCRILCTGAAIFGARPFFVLFLSPPRNQSINRRGTGHRAPPPKT